MKRIIYNLLFLISIVSLYAQENPNSSSRSVEMKQDTFVNDKSRTFRYNTYTPNTRHYFNINLGAGLGSYIVSKDENASSRLGAGQIFQLEYKYFFGSHWGIGVGVGVSHRSSTINAHRVFDVWETGSAETDALFHHDISNFSELQHFIDLKVPIQIHYRTRMNYQSSFHIGLGFAFDKSLYSHYKFKGGIYEISRQDYDKTHTIPYSGDDPYVYTENSETNEIMGVIREEFNGNKGNIKRKSIGVDVVGDLGFLYNTSRTFALYFGLYASYGLSNHKMAGEKGELMYNSKTKEFKSVSGTDFVKQLNSIEAGVKIGFDFCIRSRAEKDELQRLEEENQKMMNEQKRVTDSLQALLEQIEEDLGKLDYIDSVSDFRRSFFISSQTDVKMLIYAIDEDKAYRDSNENTMKELSPSVALIKQNIFSLGADRKYITYQLDEEGKIELDRSSKIGLRYFKSLLNARNTSVLRYCLLDTPPFDENHYLNKEYIEKSNSVVNDFLDNRVNSKQLEMSLPQRNQHMRDSNNAIFQIIDYGISSPMESFAFYFDKKNNLVISKDASKHIDHLVDYIKRNESVSVNIVGNYSGSNLYTNCYIIALLRAEKIKKELVNRGVSENKISCYSHANRASISHDRNNEYMQALNNRIDIEVYRK